MISTKILIHRVSVDSTGDFLQKNVLPTLLAAFLNFCIKLKNGFVSETERDF